MGFSIKATVTFGRGVATQDAEALLRSYGAAGFSGSAFAGVGYSERYGVEAIYRFESIILDDIPTAVRFLKTTAGIGREAGEAEVLVELGPNADASVLVSTSELAEDGTPKVRHVLSDTFPVCPDCGQKHPPVSGEKRAQLVRALMGLAGGPRGEAPGDPAGVPFGLPDKGKRRLDN